MTVSINVRFMDSIPNTCIALHRVNVLGHHYVNHKLWVYEGASPA